MDRRDIEISQVITNALNRAVILEEMPRAMEIYELEKAALKRRFLNESKS